MIVLLSFGLALLFCLLLASSYSPFNIVDTPNARSLHEDPTPRTGGIGMLVAILIASLMQGWLNGMPAVMGWVGAAALMIAVVSCVDDVCVLSPLVRIVVHAMAAVVLVVGGLVVFDGWLGMLFTGFAVVWMLNLYNFMDGMDGFAGGMSLFGFAFLAAAGWLQGAEVYAMFASIIAASALGFLCVNFPPAKIFMGDAGSATLGLCVAALSLWGIHDGLFLWWFPLLVFSPFIVDATVTLIRRLVNRERIWEAHRSHYYQRLVQLGWGHKKTVLAEYVLMFMVGLSALFLLQVDKPMFVWLMMSAWAGVFMLIAVQIHRMEGERSV